MRTTSARAKGTRELIAFYFEPQEDGNTYRCKARHCQKLYKQKQGTGYTNLKNHLQTCIGYDYEKKYLQQLHPSLAQAYEEKMREGAAGMAMGMPSPNGSIGHESIGADEDEKKLDPLLSAFPPSAIGVDMHKELYRWIDWLVARGFPPTEADNHATRRAVRFGRVSSQSLRKCMLGMVMWVQMSMVEMLPKHFGLVLDSWIEDHGNGSKMVHTAVFATFMNKGFYEELLLGVAPAVSIDEEPVEVAKRCLEFIRKVIAEYSHEANDVMVVVAEANSANKLIASELGVPFVGSVHTRFDMAINAYLYKDEEIKGALSKIEKLVGMHRTLEAPATQQALVFTLFPVEQMTSSSTPEWQRKLVMLKRFFQHESALVTPEIMAAVNVSTQEIHRLYKLVEHLENFDSVARNLKSRGLHLAETRINLDLIIEDYPEFGAYLSPSAVVVDFPIFETAVAKLIKENNASLSTQEKEALRLLELRDSSAITSTGAVKSENGKSPSYAEKLEARKRQRLMANMPAYIDARFIPSSSAVLERVFGQSMTFVKSLRRQVSPVLLDAYLLLQGNRKCWNLSTVHKSMKTGDQVEQVKLDDDTFYLAPLGIN